MGSVEGVESEVPDAARAVVSERADGICLWLTGRSGAGKSTLTAALLPMLEQVGRTVTLLDVVPELRKLRCESTSRGKLIRKAFVAREVVRHGGVAICVTVSSNREVREEARNMVGAESFIEVFVDAPLDVSERRRNTRPSRPTLAKRVARRLKRLRRALARRAGGLEVPTAPDLTINTTTTSPEQGAREIFDLLVERGIVGRHPG